MPRSIPATWPTMRRSTRCFRLSPNTGPRASTASCTPSPSPRARRSRASSTKASRAKSFRIAHDVSSYSLAALAKAAAPHLQGRKAAIVTLSYLGAVRSIPRYNVMGLAKASLEACVRYLAAGLGPQGIRVNAISAGPIKTLAAAGIGDFGKIFRFVEKNAPLRRNVSAEEVGNVAAFLLSDLASGITGEVTYVDAGFSTTTAGLFED